MVAAAVGRWGTLDILVNNAWGGGRLGRLERKTPELMQHGINIGFLGPFWAMVAAHPIMKAAGYGRIINICSLNGVNAHMGTVEYNTSKEALRAATRTAAREWADCGITANIICPAAKSASFHATMSAHPELVDAADAANPNTEHVTLPKPTPGQSFVTQSIVQAHSVGPIGVLGEVVEGCRGVRCRAQGAQGESQRYLRGPLEVPRGSPELLGYPGRSRVSPWEPWAVPERPEGPYAQC